MSKGSRTRNTILNLAADMAAKVGLHGLTIGGLAKAVGMSKSGLFAHFDSKDNLQLLILKMAANHMTESVFFPAFKKKRGLPRIKAIFNNWITYLEDQDSLPGGRLLISASVELNDQPGPLRDYIKEVMNDLMNSLERAVEIACEEGHFRSDLDVKQFAYTWYSIVLGYHHYSRVMGDTHAKKKLKTAFNKLINEASTQTLAKES